MGVAAMRPTPQGMPMAMPNNIGQMCNFNNSMFQPGSPAGMAFERFMNGILPGLGSMLQRMCQGQNGQPPGAPGGQGGPQQSQGAATGGAPGARRAAHKPHPHAQHAKPHAHPPHAHRTHPPKAPRPPPQVGPDTFVA
jgi:hypothetical protein